VILLGLLAFAAAQRTNGFNPPTALSSDDGDVSLSYSPQTISRPRYELYELTPVSGDSPLPFSVVTLPSFSNQGNQGPVRPYTKIDGHINQHLRPVPELSPFSIQDFSPMAPLFGSHSENSAGLAQMSVTVLAACVALVLAL